MPGDALVVAVRFSLDDAVRSCLPKSCSGRSGSDMVLHKVIFFFPSEKYILKLVYKTYFELFKKIIADHITD